MSKLLVTVIMGFAFLSGIVFAMPTIPTQTKDSKLYDMLPAEIKKQGTITNVFDGSFPPYVIVSNNNVIEGVSIDMAQAVSELLGVKIEHKLVDSFSGMLAGVQSGRYQLTIGPIGDFPDRHGKMDFVDFINEFQVFAVKKGNPEKINSLNDTCGKRIAALAGGSGEHVVRAQSKLCVEQKKKAIDVQAYPDSSTMLLAVQSNRADASFDSVAPLTYMIYKTGSDLELTETGVDNGFGNYYQASALPKDSSLTPVLLAAYQTLFDNGTYAAIMKKWRLERNMISAPGINLAKKEHKK